MQRLRITVDGKAYEVVVENVDQGSNAPAAAPIRSAAAAAPAARAAAAPAPAPTPKAAAGAGDMTSPLAGVVQAIEVAVGTQVKEGELVITLEAMKMYTPINATSSGTIQAIHVNVGDAVDEGQPLFTIG